MNREIKVIFAVLMLMTAVFLSGCTGSHSAGENDLFSGKSAENVNSVVEQENSTDQKMMSVREDTGTSENATGSSLNNTTQGTSASSLYYVGSGSSSGSGKSTSDNTDSGSNDTTESNSTSAWTVTDLAGREITVPEPENLGKISCLHPIATYMTWRLAPEKLISVDMVFNANPRLVPDDADEFLSSLPVTGVYFKGMNQEQMLALDPDVIVSMTKDPNIDQEQIDYDAPIVTISKDRLGYYEQSFRFMGTLLGNEEEADELADYWNSSITKVTDITSEIPGDQRLKVYYSSHDGPLSTVGPETVMSSIINLAGGTNLYDTKNSSLTSADLVNEHLTVNIEEIILWDPDVIITKTEADKNFILNDTQWEPITAVKNGRVYAAPRWESLDGVQSIMGLMWTAETLYPDKVTFDFNNETRAFYSKFYLYDNMTDEQIAETVA